MYSTRRPSARTISPPLACFITARVPGSGQGHLIPIPLTSAYSPGLDQQWTEELIVRDRVDAARNVAYAPSNSCLDKRAEACSQDPPPTPSHELEKVELAGRSDADWFFSSSL